jgi:hypothetical protein
LDVHFAGEDTEKSERRYQQQNVIEIKTASKKYVRLIR